VPVAAWVAVAAPFPTALDTVFVTLEPVFVVPDTTPETL
jgi:alpha-D-ribose 1-methylphosphonate 5-triphosphate synthase subunit PhnH